MMNYKWRVLIELWSGEKINKYFHNKTEAIKFFKENYDNSLSAQIFKYNGRFWVTKKFWV